MTIIFLYEIEHKLSYLGEGDNWGTGQNVIGQGILNVICYASSFHNLAMVFNLSVIEENGMPN